MNHNIRSTDNSKDKMEKKPKEMVFKRFFFLLKFAIDMETMDRIDFCFLFLLEIPNEWTWENVNFKRHSIGLDWLSGSCSYIRVRLACLFLS